MFKKIIICLIISTVVLTSSLAYAKINIYCPNCKKHLYIFQKRTMFPGQIQKHTDYVAVNGANEPCEYCMMDEVLVCPDCKAPLNGYLYWFWKRRRELPKMPFPGITYYILDKDTNTLKWYPYEVDLQD